MSYKSDIQEWPTRLFRKTVLQECPTRVTIKSVPQECPTRVSHKCVPQECPRRVGVIRGVPQECARVSHQAFRKECVLQECPTRVSPTRVPKIVWVFEYVFTFGFVGSTLFMHFFFRSFVVNFCVFLKLLFLFLKTFLCFSLFL